MPKNKEPPVQENPNISWRLLDSDSPSPNRGNRQAPHPAKRQNSCTLVSVLWMIRLISFLSLWMASPHIFHIFTTPLVSAAAFVCVPAGWWSGGAWRLFSAPRDTPLESGQHRHVQLQDREEEVQSEPGDVHVSSFRNFATLAVFLFTYDFCNVSFDFSRLAHMLPQICLRSMIDISIFK